MSSSHGFACVTRVYICSALRWALVLHPEIVSLCAHWWGYVSMSWEQSFRVTLYPTLYTRNDAGESRILGGKIALYSTLSRDRAKVIRWEIFFCLSLMMLDEQTAACCVLVWHHITVWSKVGKREWFDLTLCIVGARLKEKNSAFPLNVLHSRKSSAKSRTQESRALPLWFSDFADISSPFFRLSVTSVFFSLESRTTARTISQQSFIILVCLFPMPSSFVSLLPVYMQMIFRPWFPCCRESFGTMTTTTMNIYSLHCLWWRKTIAATTAALLCCCVHSRIHVSFKLLFGISKQQKTFFEIKKTELPLRLTPWTLIRKSKYVHKCSLCRHDCWRRRNVG